MMTRALRFALLADGMSDRALIHVIRWTLLNSNREMVLGQPGFRHRDASRDFRQEMTATVEIFRPDILFVHRDAEGQDPELRRLEIPEIATSLVRLIPVRMTEAGLLFDEPAIRSAAGNPAGRMALNLPHQRHVESIADPKTLLHELLVTAADVTGRKRKQFNRDLASRVHRVAELIVDFSSLRRLSAFRRFEADCRSILQIQA